MAFAKHEGYAMFEQDCLADQIHHFGFCEARAGIEPAALLMLRHAAQAQLRSAQPAQQLESGKLQYQAFITELGPTIERHFERPELLELLASLFGASFALTSDRSCLTRYKAGDHLGAHRDEPADECDVTIIAYLKVVDGSPCETDALSPRLNIYTRERPRPEEEPRLVIPSAEGTLVIGIGSQIWHERPDLTDGQEVVAVTGCYHRL
ncbi:MAG: hypothetical protein AAF559_11210 [Pseudomonadota bacterium]